MLDARAAVLLASRTIRPLVTLGRLVAPHLAQQLEVRTAAMVAVVNTYSNTTRNLQVSGHVWRDLAQRIAAVQASLGELDGQLNGLGTGRPYA